MGYQQVTVKSGYTLFTVTFKEVGKEAYDIQNITPYKDGAVVSDNNMVTIQKMDKNGNYLKTYNFREGKGGWCDGMKFIGTDVVAISNAEAVCVYNSYETPIQLQVSGEVEITPWSVELGQDYSLVGNMTPCKIDIQDIVPYDLEGKIIAVNNVVTIQKMDNDGNYLKTYNFREGKGGWCDGMKFAGTGEVYFEPGESACVYNSSGASIKLKFKSPLEK